MRQRRRGHRGLDQWRRQDLVRGGHESQYQTGAYLGGLVPAPF